jgi:hypothetical protein
VPETEREDSESLWDGTTTASGPTDKLRNK